MSAKLMALADKFIRKQLLGPGGHPLARHHREELHLWNGTHFEPVPTRDFWRRILAWLDKNNEEATPKIARDVYECVASRLLVPAQAQPPVWLGERQNGPDDPSHWASMRNGILDITKAMSGEADALRAHTPLWFSPTVLPFDFDPSAKCPRWLGFLAQVFDEDGERINLLAEWFGYCLTSDTSLQKFMLMVGPRRAGKGTILRIMQKLMGEDNCTAPRLTTMAGTFGLWGLLGKTNAVCPDAHIGQGDASVAVLELLKSIVGEDALEIHRKCLSSVTARLRVRFTLAVNDLPQFGDSAGALSSRLLILLFRNSYAGSEDTKLESKLTAELPGIFNWAIGGLSRLRKNGRFTIPAASREVTDDFARLSSPIRAFIEDCCKAAPTAMVNTDDLWQAWTKWCRENGHVPGSREILGTRLRTIIPRLDVQQFRTPDGKRSRRLVGLELIDEPVTEGANGR